MSSLHNLADVHQARGRLEEAIVLHREVIEIKERIYGPEHPSLAATLDSMGLCLFSQRQYDEAERLYERARRILEKAVEPGHPELATVLNNLAGLYHKKAGCSRPRTYTRAPLRSTDRLSATNTLWSESACGTMRSCCPT